STVKAGVKDFMPENVNIIGKARYTNDTADYLKITVTVQAKSYTEIYSLMQLLNELSANFSSTDMELIIEIKQLEETVMILHREKGTMKTTVLDIS
ncbi:MAG: CamS family sex pheromone protein, partial [Holdemania filiformis]